MKAFRIFFLVVFPMVCQTALAQTVNSSVTIKIKDGGYIVSGVVPGDAVNEKFAESVRKPTGGAAEEKKLEETILKVLDENNL